MKTFGTILFNVLLIVSRSSYATPYWDWKNINTNTIRFPRSFEWGTTTLSYEVDGAMRNSTWYAWEKHTHGVAPQKTMPNHWDNYQDDIRLMSEAGLTSYCLSIDWSRVEPEENYFDKEALQHYADVCAELVDNDIKPIIILKDYCDPLWFAYIGGFEKEENILLFEDYCTTVFEKLHPYVHQWITFWAPENYAMLGYLLGTVPPHISNAQKAFTVLKNQLEAHVRVYKTLKMTAHGNDTHIGIVKHMYLLEAWYPWDKPLCAIADMLVNSTFYSFFLSGLFSVKIPLPGRAGAWVTHSNPHAQKSVDFIGINYHSHGYLKNLKNHVGNPREIPTDIDTITMYPEGLYFSIKEISEKLTRKLDIPIYITQNGIATTDENIRDLYIKRHLYALSKALADGYNVLGYCYYGLLDCYTWGNTLKNFGLFSLDRTPKNGSRFYLETIKRF